MRVGGDIMRELHLLFDLAVESRHQEALARGIA
jgi:hypothetical protein